MAATSLPDNQGMLEARLEQQRFSALLYESNSKHILVLN